ncbi:uncharacterized protein LOC112560674 [Pomacea canaliculata]|uniref:uncharacterized protein LOC112560674 n=1 Tax=Pomacea canaliculata TaxID=400727 RepID=UPI000D72FCED|nr:uncharacterized protein LOC112560674 [Pomacea canaliculata]
MPVKAPRKLFRVGDLAMCPIPKSGSTFWKQVLLYIHDNKTGPFFEADYGDVHKRAFRHEKPASDVIDDDTITAVFVREPYARLFSGYMDKIFQPRLDNWRRFARPMADFLLSGVEARHTIYHMCPANISFAQFVTYFIAARERCEGHRPPEEPPLRPAVLPVRLLQRRRYARHNAGAAPVAHPETAACSGPEAANAKGKSFKHDLRHEPETSRHRESRHRFSRPTVIRLYRQNGESPRRRGGHFGSWATFWQVTFFRRRGPQDQAPVDPPDPPPSVEHTSCQRHGPRVSAQGGGSSTGVERPASQGHHQQARVISRAA